MASAIPCHARAPLLIVGVRSLDKNAAHYKGFAKKIDQEQFIGAV
jgi:hypothetical protein